MYENISENLPKNSLLRNQVEAAIFMLFHEKTTYIFVDGWPKYLPRKIILKGNMYIDKPQVLLLLSVFLNIKPKIFENEVANEVAMLINLDIKLKESSDYEQLKEILQHLHKGYEYIDNNFRDFYEGESKLKRFTKHLSKYFNVDKMKF